MAGQHTVSTALLLPHDAIQRAPTRRQQRRMTWIDASSPPKSWGAGLQGTGAVRLPVSGSGKPLYLEALCPMELPELFRQEPAHHLRPHNELPQPMAYRKEPFSLVRRHPLAGRMFVTESYRRKVLAMSMAPSCGAPGHL